MKQNVLKNNEVIIVLMHYLQFNLKTTEDVRKINKILEYKKINISQF